MNREVNSLSKKANIVVNIILLMCVLICIVPVLLVVVASFTTEQELYHSGYSFFPKTFSLDGYKLLFQNGEAIFRAYGVTIFVTLVGTLLSVSLIALFAYPLSRKDLKYRNIFSFIVFFTMLFSGGTVSWYLVCTKFLHLGNSIQGLIVPYLMNAFYVIVLRTFFANNIPDSLIEAAKLDGSGEWNSFLKVVLPLSKPGLATIGIFSCIGFWNDWWLPLMLISDDKYNNLQFMIYRLMMNIQFLADNSSKLGSVGGVVNALPKESARMAMCVITIGPIILIYPFFQKYFIKGLTIGSVKG